jgi:hypothetical protein
MSDNSMPNAGRTPLPFAHCDPAFAECLKQAVETPMLLEQFDRVYGATLVSRKSTIERLIDEATGKQSDDMRAFCEFVHNAIYMRLPDEAIHSLRASFYAKKKSTP